MYLATVTCNRDFQQLLLQAESVQKFLQPCKHVIIINETSPDLVFYHKWLDRFYTNHELILRPRIPYHYPVEGFRRTVSNDGSSIEWQIQQLQKLLLAYEYEEDYLLLDSKNFFIKPASLSYYMNKDFYGSGSVKILGHNYEGREDKYGANYKIYLKLLDIKETPEYITTINTPYKIHRDLLVNRMPRESLGNYLFAPNFYNSVTSEFTFYGLLLADHTEKFKFNDFEHRPCILWPWNPHVDHIDHYLYQSANSKSFVMGFHRDFLNLTGPEHIERINNWLHEKIGLNTKVMPYIRDHTMTPYKH